jgi:hypothetical protein
MKMDHVWARFLEDAEKAARGVRQMLTHVRLHSETVRSHPFAERAKSRYRVYAGFMTLLPLQTAHLRDERLGPANLHAVNNVRNYHVGD